jgi:hypothetical protein
MIDASMKTTTMTMTMTMTMMIAHVFVEEQLDWLNKSIES